MSTVERTSDPIGGPLSALRIVDISQGIAGPFAAKLLADLGADVIKVEPPSVGDVSRSTGPFPDSLTGSEASGTFYFNNTSKRSIALDLSQPAGRDTLLSLLRSHDIVMASDTEPELARQGLGYETLSATSPRMILTTVTGFGSSGPYAGYAATHLINCAMGGWAATCGLAEREPLQSGGNVTDYIAGAYAAVGTMAAVEARARDGQGQHVDVSSMEATITAALLPTMYWEYTGALQERKSSRSTGPSWIFQCADGYVGANVLTQPQWEALCQFIGMPEVLDRDEYALPAERLARSDELHAMFAPWFAERRVEEVFHEAQAWRLPFGLVPSLTDILSLEQHSARGFFVDMPHPTRPNESMPFPGLPFRMPRSPSRPTVPPALGQHTDEVLHDLLGLSTQEIAGLKAKGVC